MAVIRGTTKNYTRYDELNFEEKKGRKLYHSCYDMVLSTNWHPPNLEDLLVEAKIHEKVCKQILAKEFPADRLIKWTLNGKAWAPDPAGIEGKQLSLNSGFKVEVGKKLHGRRLHTHIHAVFAHLGRMWFDYTEFVNLYNEILAARGGQHKIVYKKIELVKPKYSDYMKKITIPDSDEESTGTS